MAIFSSGSNATWLLSLKVLLASTLVLSAAVLLKLYLPAIAGFVTCELPSLYGLLLAWLRPPYLYILINCIIISIVASSKLQQKADGDQAPEAARPEYAAPPPETVARAPPEDLNVPEVVTAEYGDYGIVYDPSLVTVVDDAYGGGDGGALVAEAEDEAVVAVDGGDVLVVPESVSPPLRSDSSDFSFLSSNEDGREKPRVSARFGHRKSAKSGPEGNLSHSHSRLFYSTSDFKTPLMVTDDFIAFRCSW